MVKVVALLERLVRVRSRFFSLDDMVRIFAATGAHIDHTEGDLGNNVRLIIGR